MSAVVANDVSARLEAVRRRIRDAARASSRDPETVRLVAVSKTMDSSIIRLAYEAGQRDFGENYAQELSSKAAELDQLSDLRWHFIGHLQRNKAKLVTRVASLIHTVDSIRLVDELDKRAGETPVPAARVFPIAGTAADSRLPVLVEVNIAGEAQKSGASPMDLGAILDAVEAHSRLALAGLMSVPPAARDPSASRPYFDELAAIRDEHGGARRLPELSIGMSHDLEEAIFAGATLVRVGTAIFGERTRTP